MNEEESNLLGVIAGRDQVNESSDGCDLGERSTAKSLGRDRFG